VWTVALAYFITRRAASPQQRIRFIHNAFLIAAVLLVGGLNLYTLLGGQTSGDIFEERNFNGMVRVKEVNSVDPQWSGYTVMHGITVRGLQFTAPDKTDLPTAYATEGSGVGLAMLNHPKYGHGMRVGVLDLAEGRGGYFSYLANSQAKQIVTVGDVRISLEKELAANGSDRFDLLVLDCFSGDAPRGK
jgi:hypothetical protein